MKHKKPPSTDLNALDVVKRMTTVIEKALPSLDGYREQLESRKPLEPEVGKFYRTFDGSIVVIAEETTIQIPNESRGDNVLEAILPQENPLEKDVFVCSVVRGGHGIARVSGSGPGANYSVDKTGLSYFGRALNDGQSDLDVSINLAFLCLVGLSLKHEVSTQFRDPR